LGADTNIVDTLGIQTPIFYCKESSILKMLLETGVDLEFKNKDGKTFLKKGIPSDLELIIS